MDSIAQLEIALNQCLQDLAEDPHVRSWNAKENNWVSYFAFKYLVGACRQGTPLSDPAQIGVEVSVPQPPELGKTRGVRRDTVIWRSPGLTCWNDDWEVSADPINDPLAIIEWKVHRPRRRNPLVTREREWLHAYCAHKPSVLAYAVEVDGGEVPPVITWTRFLGTEKPWKVDRSLG